MFFEPNLKFGWYVMLIGLPAVALAIVGGFSLQQDRVAARSEAVERAGLIADEFSALRSRVERRVKEQYSEWGDPASLIGHDLVAITIGNEGELVFPPPILDEALQTSWRYSVEDDRDYEDWARKIAGASNQEELIRLSAEIELKRMKENLKASLLWLLARAMSRFDASATASIHEQLARDFASARLRSGARAGVLSLMWLLENPSLSSNLKALANRVGSNLMDDPDAFSSAQMMEISSIMSSSNEPNHDANFRHLSLAWGTLEGQWNEHESLRLFYRQAAVALQLSSSNRLDAATIPFQGEDWLVWILPSEGLLLGRQQSGVLAELSETRRLHSVDPHFSTSADFESPAIVSEGHDVLLERFIPSDVAWPGVYLTVKLLEPARYFAGVDRRQSVFLALILFSLITVLVGLLSLHRGLQRQHRVNQLRSNFVASVSHELRTPAASISLLSEELISGVNDASRYHYLIHNEAQRLAALVENVLDVSRIERGAKQYEFDNTDVRRLVASTVDQFQAVAKRSGVCIRLDTGPEEVECVLDSIAIQRAIRNLLDNALKYSTKGTAISVALEVALDGVTISVTDQGCGIEPEQIGAIFQPFTRLGSELRRESTGVGLGLALTKHIVEAHRGTISVASEQGKGSRFEIHLPRECGDA